MEANFLLLFAAMVAGIAIGVVVMLVVKARYPQNEQNVGQALLLVALALRATFDDAEVMAVAGWVYERTMVSQYYSKDDWIALALRVFALLPQQTAVQASAAASDAPTDNQVALPL